MKDLKFNDDKTTITGLVGLSDESLAQLEEGLKNTASIFDVIACNDDLSINQKATKIRELIKEFITTTTQEQQAYIIAQYFMSKLTQVAIQKAFSSSTPPRLEGLINLLK